MYSFFLILIFLMAGLKCKQSLSHEHKANYTIIIMWTVRATITIITRGTAQKESIMTRGPGPRANFSDNH